MPHAVPETKNQGDGAVGNGAQRKIRGRKGRPLWACLQKPGLPAVAMECSCSARPDCLLPASAVQWAAATARALTCCWSGWCSACHRAGLHWGRAWHQIQGNNFKVFYASKACWYCAGSYLFNSIVAEVGWAPHFGMRTMLVAVLPVGSKLAMAFHFWYGVTKMRA